MKYLLALVVVVGAAGAAFFLLQTPERRSCAKLAELCGSAAMTADQCVDALTQLKKASGQAPIDKLASCTSTATSCPGALGCLTGVGVSSATGVVGDFLKGLGGSLQK